MSDRISRRDFFTYGGSVVAGLTLGEWGRRQLARADAGVDPAQRREAERWTVSVCRDCAAACGLRVRLAGDAPVKLEGNPSCPIGRGRLCAAGQASIEAYYDPDRLVGPARRSGARGENKWTRTSWNDALGLLASALAAPAGAPDTRPVAVAVEEHGPLADGWTSFWSHCGGRVAWQTTATAAALRPALAGLTGVDRDPLFDLERATYLLSFGAPIVESWLSPVWTQRSFGRFRRGEDRPRGRLVQVDVRRSMTARKADEWLPLPVEHQVVLAYGIASVILRENRIERRALDALGGNVAAFEHDVVGAYSADDVSTLTGIPVVTILRLARELTSSPQPLVVAATDAPRTLIDAGFALNALVGALDRPGGVWAAGIPPEPVEDAGPLLQEIAANRLRPRVLALRDASALRTPAAPSGRNPFAAAPLVVSFSPYLDEAAAAADLLLPIHTTLESWHAVRPAAAAPLEAVAIAPPAVAARLDTRDAAAILANVAHTIGGSAAAACRWQSSADLVTAEIDRLWRLRRGAPYARTYETEWLQQLETGGWWSPGARDVKEFGAAVLDAGGWIDPFFERGLIQRTLQDRGGATFALPGAAPALAAVRASKRSTEAPTEASSPEHDESTGALPFQLVVFPAASLQAADLNQPALYELLGQPEGSPWRPWVEIGAEDAENLNIEQGRTVRIASATGTVEAVAVVVPGMSPGIVALSHVPAGHGGGRWARQIREDARALLGTGGSTAVCRVRLARV